MSGFAETWLELRAPADAAARDRGLEDRLARWAAGRPLSVADLGGGTGAATRALSARLPDARWAVYDDDAALLSRLPEGAEGRRLDLARNIERVFDPAPDLVTGFAFFDLVSAAWMQRLADLLAAAGAALYAPLIYDGRERWRPEPPHEAEALAAFAADMGRDKGFGPALGPAAGPRLAEAMAARGYRVFTAESPWRLTPGPLLAELARGGAAAVAGRMPAEAHARWTAGRAGAASAEIGHLDVLALPPEWGA